MRLTLRSLLAYLDDALKDPTARAEIASKLTENPSVQQFAERIHEVTHRARLGTPKLHGKGLGADANSVAEYLDHTMQHEQVQEFEKVALDSDIQLAEVASCHQILALVLGQPAEVDPNLRRKMYDIVHQAHTTVAGPHPTPAAAPVKATVATESLPKKSLVAATVTSNESEHETEVPEYLRAGANDGKLLPRWAWWAVAAALLFGIMRIIGPFDGSHPIAKMFAPGTDQTIAKNTSTNQPNPNENKAVIPQPTTPAVEPPIANKVSPTIPGPNDPANTTGPNLNPPKTDVPAINPTTPVTPMVPLVEPMPPVAVTPPAPPQPEAGIARVEPMPMTPAPAMKPPVIVKGVIGRMSQDSGQVLLSLKNQTDQGWQKLSALETVESTDRLLSLHPFRPSITLKNGMTLMLIGETQLELFATEQADQVRLRLHFGRVVLINAGKANTSLLVEAGVNSQDQLTLVDPDSSAAIEVTRQLAPGSNPETSTAQVMVRLYAAQGRLNWSHTPPTVDKELKAPEQIALFGEPGLVETNGTPKPLPTWISRADATGVDSSGGNSLNLLLSQSKQSVVLSMKEIASTNRRSEVRYLALRGLALLDEFEPFMSSLGDLDQKAFWNREIECLQSALTRGPETAALVRETFTKQRPDYGGKLYRYLWGVTREDLAAGLADELLDGMEADNVEQRVLSFATLRDAFRDPKSDLGGPTHGYQVDAPVTQRQTSMNKWRSFIREQIKRNPTANVPMPTLAAPKTPNP
jgi:hypothetical protein